MNRRDLLRTQRVLDRILLTLIEARVEIVDLAHDEAVPLDDRAVLFPFRRFSLSLRIRSPYLSLLAPLPLPFPRTREPLRPLVPRILARLAQAQQDCEERRILRTRGKGRVQDEARECVEGRVHAVGGRG